MVTYLSDELGTAADTISVSLDGEKLAITTGWSQTESILSQPSHWTLELGWGDVAADLLTKFRKRAVFQVFVGNQQQMYGEMQGVFSTMSLGQATTVTLRGYDYLHRLHKSYVRAAVDVKVNTYADLVWHALGEVGLTGGEATVDPTILRTDNNANRTIKAGVQITALLPHETVQQILDNPNATAPTGTAGSVATYPQAHVGETWLHFIRRYCDRAGLMLWSAADGSFVLAAPDANQAASYAIRRRTGDPTAGGNIVGHVYHNDASERHSEIILYGRGGGRILGRVKAKGFFVDQEMVGFGYDQPKVHRDVNVHTSLEAEFFARRQLAEERRNGIRLEYVLSGLTLPFAPTGGTQRAVVIPDTVVTVDDDMLGINGDFYIESVTRSRSPQTSCTIRLMRIEDLIFGAPDEEP